MAKQFIKMWVTAPFKNNLKVIQQNIRGDLGLKVPLHQIAYAVSRQGLNFADAGLRPHDLVEKKGRRKRR